MTTHTAHHDDDLGARLRRIQNRILDGIEQTLDELEGAPRASIAGVVAANIAPLSCRQALCKRAKRCRRNPCVVPYPNLAPITGRERTNWKTQPVLPQ